MGLFYFQHSIDREWGELAFVVAVSLPLPQIMNGVAGQRLNSRLIVWEITGWINMTFCNTQCPDLIIFHCPYTKVIL